MKNALQDMCMNSAGERLNSWGLRAQGIKPASNGTGGFPFATQLKSPTGGANGVDYHTARDGVIA